MELVKAWTDWSDGVGYLRDDGRGRGMYYASGLLGLRGELRPAPLMNTATLKESIIRWDAESTKKFSVCGVAVNPSTGGTVTYDATGNGAAAAAGLTFAVNVGAGSNRYLVVGVSNSGAAAPTGVTYDAVAMTKLVENTDTAGVISSLWGIIAPNTGNNNVIVTMGGAVDIVGGGISYTSVDQTTPTNDTDSISGTLGTFPDYWSVLVDCLALGQVVGVAASAGLLGIGKSVDETERWDAAQGTVRGEGAHRAKLANYQPTYFIEEEQTAGSRAYMYVYRGNVAGDKAALCPKLTKVSIFDASYSFGDTLGEFEFATLDQPGQPARYQAYWYFPASDVTISRKLTVGSGLTSADTLSGPTSVTDSTEDHLANLSHQLIGHRKDSGVRILKVDGTPTTEADWGSYFPVGDKNERAAGLIGLEGMSFVMNQEGLFSFNSKGRSRLVFEDFRTWRNVFENIPMSAWKGGLLLPHPSGLLWYLPGERPVNVGIGSKMGLDALPPSGPTEIHGGRFHGTKVVGEFCYTVYQPDISSTSAYLACMYAPSGEPTEPVWQILGSVTLQNVAYVMGVGVTLQSRPVSANYVTPVVWTGNGDDLAYVVLDSRASPFRSRADTHKVCTSADAYMSELFFSEPVKLAKLVVHTSADMVDGDEFQISIYPDGTGKNEKVGEPIRGSGTRHERPISRHPLSRMILRVNWTATDATNRVPPVITRIELYGEPAKKVS